MASQTLTIRKPDDWHVHLRDGEMLRRVAPYTARQFARAIVMPNLVPPITTVEAARDYRKRILEATQPGFTPLMTCYLTDDLSPDAGIPGVTSPADEAQAAVTRLVEAGASANWASELARHDIKYVLLAHQVDWQQFRFLGSQPDLVVVADYGSIVLYRNLLWRASG